MISATFVILASLGAVARAAITTLDGEFMRRMYGTAAVNVVGSFLLGALAGSSASSMTVVGVGGLGALTTFSTYVSQVECIHREGSSAGAAVYAVGSLAAGIAAAWLGFTISS